MVSLLLFFGMRKCAFWWKDCCIILREIRISNNPILLVFGCNETTIRVSNIPILIEATIRVSIRNRVPLWWEREMQRRLENNIFCLAEAFSGRKGKWSGRVMIKKKKNTYITYLLHTPAHMGWGPCMVSPTSCQERMCNGCFCIISRSKNGAAWGGDASIHTYRHVYEPNSGE